MINQGITLHSQTLVETLRSISSIFLRRGAILALLMCSLAICVTGQNIKFTQGNVGSGLENTIRVPLRTYPGRGTANLPVTLNYSSRVWRIGVINTINNNLFSHYQSITEAIYAEHSTAGWTTSMDLPIIEWPRNDDTYYYTGKPYCAVCGSNTRQFRVARVYIILPDGSRHELRKSDQPYEGSIDMLGTFYAVDGSRLRYDSTGQSTGTLFFPDGTRYKLLSGGDAQYIDRNGNTLSYSASNRQWTDALDRAITVPVPATPTVGTQLYSLPGMPLPYKFIWKHLSETGVLTPLANGSIPALKPIANDYLPFPNQTPTAPSGNNFPVTIQTNYTERPSLFISDFADSEDTGPLTIVVGRGQVQAALFDPIVLTEIVLPNNLSYKFTYNIYGEIDKVVYPTGAFERYQYNQIPAIGDVKTPYVEANRGVTLRQVSANGLGTDLVDWNYGSTGAQISITPPFNGARTEIYRRIFPTPEHQGTQGTLNYYWPFGFEDARQGEIFEERVYAPGPQGAMLRRTLRDSAFTSNTVLPSIPQLDPTNKIAYRNARIVKEVSLILDTGGDALVKTLSYEYASNNYELSTGLDLTAINESHFKPFIQSTSQTGTIDLMPLGLPASRREMSYLDDAAYRDRNILGLPTTLVLKDGNSQVVSKLESFYDESAYSVLPYTDLAPANYIDPGTPARGNITTSRRYVDIPGNVFLDSHARFDQCGNLRYSWNARGIQSETVYSSAFNHAYATEAISAAPDPTGEFGSSATFTTITDFDKTTGLQLTIRDNNGLVTSFSYKDDQNVSDSLNRLRKITRPDQSWTKYSFGETVGNLYTLTETQQDATHTEKTYQYEDPLGRRSRSFINEDGTNYLATDIIYDPLGRVSNVSSAYRTTSLNGTSDITHTPNWISSEYDALGRVKTVTLADGSTVQTDYQGVYTTVTDQAGRQRRKQTDALGHIIRIDEQNASGSLGTVDSPSQPTSYTYNTQGNLIHIAQGSSPVQHRYFKYDAMGRLTYERQVEQAGIFNVPDPLTGNSSWSRKWVYDETIGLKTYQGLLTSVYDARNIKSQFLYDDLNRVYRTTYSDGTPEVTNKYDQSRVGFYNKGRLTTASTAATVTLPATSQAYNFDLMGRIASNDQSVGNQTYTTTYSYNLGGALSSETYPSGRIVSYAFDDAGRLSQVSSGTTVYASQFDYTSPSGMLKSVMLGNGAVESYGYNSRLQLQSLDLTKSGTQLQHYDYKYGVYDPSTGTVDETKNNGQIAQIEGFIASQKQWRQRFAYDSLGRLASARESRGDNNAQSYLANYEYDLFGNRYQKSAQNSNNPFTQKWVEAGQYDLATNRINVGVTYDDAGNITNDTTFNNLKFQYDANNRQKQSSHQDGTGAIVSVFDAVGQRVATQVGGALVNTFVYDAMGRLVAEYGGTSASGGTKYVFSDHQGSPRTITDAAGAVLSRHDYLPFGEELGTVGMRSVPQGYTATDGNRREYAGMEAGDVAGMSHTRWREYDSASGRWTAPDPFSGSMKLEDPQSFNRYSYVNNKPVNRVDPSGLALADIGVYQTSNPEVARKIERAEDQGVKNWVAQQQSQRLPRPDRGPTITKVPIPKPGIRKHEVVTVKIYEAPDVYEPEKPEKKKDEDPTCANCGAFAVAMHQRAVPMAKVIQTYAEVDVMIMTLPLALGGEAASLGLESAEAVGESAEGFDLALGLGEHVGELAEETGSLTYAELNAGDATFIPENFEVFAEQADNIRFTTKAFDFERWGQWVVRSPESWSPLEQHVTNWELHQILTNPNWLAKTIWY